ncbi:MAG: trypsin-like peptidase domain-containing protein [Saprospiraceae bacterium]|jgi:hypothetical protein|nr:trypsin-like peptidase domain-containing protein [Saprospiraceae bacterium]
MALVKFTIDERTELRNILHDEDESRYQSFVEEKKLHACYSTSMGRLMLAAECEANTQVQQADPDRRLFRVCKRNDDKRCQAGHVLSNLKSRSKWGGFGSRLGNDYYAFLRNAEATVQIVDKSGLIIDEKPNADGKISLKSIEALDKLALSRFARNEAHRNLPLCDDAYYANERIPDTTICGSGFFIEHNKVVTAAHVLKEAFKRGISPQNLMFIRGHYVYNTQATTIEVWPNQLYLLDESELLISEQTRDGKQRGDMAWVRAIPYFEGITYPFLWNGLAPMLENTCPHIYGLGHGLGLPMKLSFGGRVQDMTYNGTSAMFTCDMNILPGSSGSPIFDANTHRLLGIVSGLHKIYTDTEHRDDCVKVIIDMSGKYSGVATHIAPFSSL